MKKTDCYFARIFYLVLIKVFIGLVVFKENFILSLSREELEEKAIYLAHNHQQLKLIFCTIMVILWNFHESIASNNLPERPLSIIVASY